jgi:hypothetical protein
MKSVGDKRTETGVMSTVVCMKEIADEEFKRQETGA